MPRGRTFVAGLAVALFSAPALAAQDTDSVERTIPRLEWGLYGGLAQTSDWLGINDDFVGLVSGVENNDLSDGFNIGRSPIFGTTVSWFISSLLGVRLHGAYMPSEFPTRDTDAVEAFGTMGPAVTAVNALAEDESDYPLNNWFVDLNLVLRPWLASGRGWLAPIYIYGGAGYLITDVAGDSDPGDLFTDEEPDLVDLYEPLGARLSYERRDATVGQGTFGIGFNVQPLGGKLGFFGEVGAHGYTAPIDAPGPDDPEFAGSLVERRMAWTVRGVLGVKLVLRDFGGPPVAPVVTDEPAPLIEPDIEAFEAPPAPEILEEPLRLCVVEDGVLREVEAIYLPVSGDTLVVEGLERVPLVQAYPPGVPPYAAAQPWVLDADPFVFDGREYVSFGVPRVIPPTQLEPMGEYQEIPLFAETGSDPAPSVVYVPLGPGCRFQPYQVRDELRVRG